MLKQFCPIVRGSMVGRGEPLEGDTRLADKAFQVEAIGNSVILILIDPGLRPRRDNYVFSKSFACKQ